MVYQHHEEILEDLDFLAEAGVIKDPEKNLRSKIDSIIRSLKNLSEKKMRIEYEIKKQKRSLEKKRRELKRTSRSTQQKISLAIESGSITSPVSTDPGILDNYLLQESNQVLEEL